MLRFHLNLIRPSTLNFFTFECGHGLDTSSTHEVHHFILMAMEVHNAPERDMDCFIKKCVCLFHDKQLRGYLSLFFAFNFLGKMLILVFNMI